MKRSFRKVTALVTLCLLFGGVGLAPEIASTSGSPVVKAAVKKTMYVKWDKIKVYKKKSTSSGVLATVKQDKKVTMITSADKNGWVKIKLSSGKKGYVKKKQLVSEKWKSRCLRIIKAEMKKLEPEIIAAGWEIDSSSGPTEWIDFQKRYCYDWQLYKEDYHMRLTISTHYDYDSTHGITETTYQFQLYKNGETKRISDILYWKGIIEALNKY